MTKRCAILNGNDPYNSKGGIETYTVQLMDVLKKYGVHVDLFFPSQLPEPSHIEVMARSSASSNFNRNLRHALWNFRGRGGRKAPDASEISRLSPHLNSLMSLAEFFRQIERHYDFAIANSFFAYSYTNPGIPTYTVLHSTFVKFAESNREVFSARQYQEEMHNRGLGAERISTIGRRVIAVSSHVAEEAREVYGAKSVFTVTSAVDDAIFFPKAEWRALRDHYGIPRKAFVGLFVGRWGPDKAVDVLQEVMSRTPGTYWLLVLGDARRCPLKETRNLRILSGLSSEAVAGAMSLADFLFHPARYEGFGMVFAEALACGLPIIAPPVGIMRQIGAEEPFRRLLLPAYAEGRDRVVEAAVATIRDLRGDPALARRVRRAGPRYARQAFDKHKWERRICAVLGV